MPPMNLVLVDFLPSRLSYGLLAFLETSDWDEVLVLVVTGLDKHLTSFLDFLMTISKLS